MGALYSYFDSKDTLLLMILGQVVDAIQQVLTTQDVTTGGVESRLGALIARHVYLTERMGPWFVFAFMEAKAFSKQGREMAIESELWTEGQLRDVIADGIAAGAFRPQDPTMAAALIKPMLQDWYVKRSKYRRRDVDPDGFVVALVEAVGAMLGRSSTGVQIALNGGM